jgi:hypothetical protein
MRDVDGDISVMEKRMPLLGWTVRRGTDSAFDAIRMEFAGQSELFLFLVPSHSV